MKKGFLAFVITMILSTAFANQAFAAELNGDEQAAYNEFCAVVEKFRSVLGDETANTYESQARSALLQVDLDATACTEFSQAVKDVDAVLTNAHPYSRSEMMKYAAQCADIINRVGAKYGMQVSVAAHGVASIFINGSEVADTVSIVKQAGFALGQTIAVAMAAVAVLGGAFVASHRLSVSAAA